MRSCARPAALAAALAVLAASAAGAAPVSPALEARVGAAVAERWSVAPQTVRLAWPRTTPGTPLPDDAPLALLGDGRDGWFVARLAGPEGAVALRVRAGAVDTVTVAARPVAPGTRLGADDLRREARPCWGPPRGDMGGSRVGWEARRALDVGAIVARPAALPPLQVAPGEPVRVCWSRGGVTLALAGVALNGARRGAPVRVRVEGRSEPLTAIVSGHGTAVLGTGGER